MKQSVPLRRGSGEAPMHPGLPGRPLDFISEDHLREGPVCAVIDAIAVADSLDRQAAQTVLRFLVEESSVHPRDEAEDLSSFLSKRCTEGDSIECAVNRIGVDQDDALRLLSEVRETLSRCVDTGFDLSADDRAKLIRLTSHLRSRPAAENPILLPIARSRLTGANLASLSAQRRERYGLAPMAETLHAE